MDLRIGLFKIGLGERTLQIVVSSGIEFLNSSNSKVLKNQLFWLKPGFNLNYFLFLFKLQVYINGNRTRYL